MIKQTFSVADSTLRRVGFRPKPAHMGYAGVKMILTQAFASVLPSKYHLSRLPRDVSADAWFLFDKATMYNDVKKYLTLMKKPLKDF